jgi:hypothetical protein
MDSKMADEMDRLWVYLSASSMVLSLADEMVDCWVVSMEYDSDKLLVEMKAQQ